MTTLKRLWCSAAAVCLCISVLNFGCRDAKSPPSTSIAPEVEVVTVQKRPVAASLELPGRTAAYVIAQVRARVDGIVLRREFEEGADVKIHQRLYKVDPAPYQAALDVSLAKLQEAKANVVSATALASRYGQLISANAVSRQDLDNAVAAQGQAEALVAAARAAVEVARINLTYTDVTSPIDGRIGISQVTQGAYVQASAATLLATVQRLDPIYVDLTQPSSEGLQWRKDVALGKINPGGPEASKVQLVLEDGTRYPLPGRLEFTDVTVSSGTDSVTVRAVFPNPDHVLLPGMFVRASLEQGREQSAFVVPQVGVTHDPNGEASVLIVDADGKVSQRTVKATRTIGDSWVVESGLSDGDRVIVAGLQKAKVGSPVRAVEANPPDPESTAAKRGGPASPKMPESK